MMDHPLIGSLSDLTSDEISAKIAELGKKLTFAMRSGNAQLCNQIRLALVNYQNEYNDRLTKETNKLFDEVIDIQ